MWILFQQDILPIEKEYRAYKNIKEELQKALSPWDSELLDANARYLYLLYNKHGLAFWKG